MSYESETLLHEYYSKLQNSILMFQLIEESLRMYIKLAYSIINKRLDNIIPFKFTYNDVQRDSLGTLLDKFAKFNNNSELPKKISAIIKWRNFCAHRAYLMTYDEQTGGKSLTKEIERMDKLIKFIDECFWQLHGELKKLDEINNMLQ